MKLKIATLRKQNGISQEELAKILGISQRATSFKERGLQERKGSELKKMAKLFDVKIDEMEF